MSNIALWDKFPPGYLPNWLEDSAWSTKATGLYPQEGSSTNWELLLDQLSKFPSENRSVLVSVIEKQCDGLLSPSQVVALNKLAANQTFTVTTGQQIHFDLGPSYVFFKISSAIALANELQLRFPKNQFIPIFWMATEDHDFQEISTSTLFNKSWVWEEKSVNTHGPVGRKSTAALHDWILWIKDLFQNNDKSTEEISVLQQIFSKPNQTLASAIQEWVLWIFRDTNLLVINPDNAELKRLAIPVFQKEITVNQGICHSVEFQNGQIQKLGFTPEAHIRACNLFYMTDNLRERIECDGDKASAVVSGKSWTLSQLSDEIYNFPERFSPNVLLRPLYQQTILPNIAYIAGPSEYRYWMQIPQALHHQDLVVPALVMRKSGVFLSKSSKKKLDKWGLTLWELFSNSSEELRSGILKKVGNNNSINTQIESIESQLQLINAALYSWKSDKLKAIKEQGDQLLRELRKTDKTEQEKAVIRVLSESEWNTLMQLQQTIASVKNPQERQFHWIQELLTSPEVFYQNNQALCRCSTNEIQEFRLPNYSDHLQYFTEPFVVIY